MSWLSRLTERIRRVFRRQLPEKEIEIEAPEIPITPPIFKEEEKPAIPAPEKEEVEIPPEIEEKLEEQPERENLIKHVEWRERDRRTRHILSRSKNYPVETSDSDIYNDLKTQYDRGGNYVTSEGPHDIKIQEGTVGDETSDDMGVNEKGSGW